MTDRRTALHYKFFLECYSKNSYTTAKFAELKNNTGNKYEKFKRNFYGECNCDLCAINNYENAVYPNKTIYFYANLINKCDGKMSSREDEKAMLSDCKKLLEQHVQETDDSLLVHEIHVDKKIQELEALDKISCYTSG